MTDDGEDSTSQSMSPDSMDEERPFKKARYVWQIKSRYRRASLRRARARGCNHMRQETMAAAGDDEEQCAVARWQTRQMARAVVDNTINQVLEDMGFAPLEETDESDAISFAFDIPYPASHNREGIEDQAVLMAIQSHGLQKPCVCAHSSAAGGASSVGGRNIPFHRRPSTPPSPPAAASNAPLDCIPSTSRESDFLAQAVAAAIQEKGLGSYASEDNG